MTALTSNTFPGDGVRTVWDFSFAGVDPDRASGTLPYLYPTDVKAVELYTDPLTGLPAARDRVCTVTAPNTATISGAPVAVGNQIRIFRKTEIRFPLVDYRDLQTVSELDLDLSNRQAIFVAQEAQDAAMGTIAADAFGNYDAADHKIVNLAPGTDPTDAVNVAQLDALVDSVSSHTLRVPMADPAVPEIPTVADRANKVLGFDASGNPQAVAHVSGTAAALAADLANSTPTTGASLIGRGVQYVASVAELRTLSKLSPSKFAVVVEVSASGTYLCLYRLLVGDESSTEFGIATIVANDGGRWRRATNSRTTDVLYADFGAAIDRSGDRLFVGGAAAHLGTNAAVQPDWLTQHVMSPAVGRTFGFQHTAQFAVLNDKGTNSGNALLAGSQTKYFTGDGNAIGMIGVAVNNCTNSGVTYAGAYAAYLEMYQMPGAKGPGYGLEIDVMNYDNVVFTSPYHQDEKQVNGIQLAAGGENANTAAQVTATNGINFWNNGQTFNQGINFGHTAIVGTDGINGVGEAITYAKGHGHQWYANESGTIVKTSGIYGETGTAAGAVTLRLLDYQVQVRGSNGNPSAQFYATPGAVNYPSLRSSVSNNAVQVTAQGSDAHIDLQLVPKGTGLLRIEATPQSGALSPNSFFNIRLNDGSVRRVLLG